jgi:SSS family solute:Na+ symporter
MWGLIAGLVIGLTRLGAKVFYSNTDVVAGGVFKYLFYDLNWLFFCGWMFLFCILVVIAVSLATRAPGADKIQGLVFGTATPAQKAETRASWNRWDVIHTCIILGITVAFYIYFW